MKHSDQEIEIIAFLKNLRTEILQGFETLEEEAKFERKNWKHHTGGGGEISLLRGNHFEKAAVNWSGVYGERLPLDQGKGPFFATGVSLITHMRNPHAPTVHMNVRYICTEKQWWFGGGYDLTPMGLAYEEDREHFHSIAKVALEPYGKELYPLFSQNAKEYFYIKHRNKERGMGGIFFDYHNSGNWERDFQMIQSVGTSLLKAILPIYKKRIHLPYQEEEKRKQLELRAHYVEFNLLYDRGTKFGFASGGNPEAILCSMPPLASW